MIKKIFISAVHLIIAFVIFLAAQILADIVSNLLSVNVIIDKLIFAAVDIAAVLLLGFVYWKYILRNPFDEIGLKQKISAVKWIIIGFVLPLAVTAFYLIFTDGQIVKNDMVTLKFMLARAVIDAGISPGICEEFVFRGLMFRYFEKQWNKPVAVIVPSVLFAAIHIITIHSMTFVDIILLLVAGTAVGVMFSLIALETGTIWASAIVHALWNIIIIGGVFIIEAPQYGTSASFLYRYELSGGGLLLTGGRFGIESSLPAVVGYLLVSLYLIIRLARKKKTADNKNS